MRAEADLAFHFRGAEKNLTEMLHLLTESKDAKERAEAMKIVNDGLRRRVREIFSPDPLYGRRFQGGGG